MRPVIISFVLLLTACATVPAKRQQMGTVAAKQLIEALPSTRERAISLALIGHPKTTFRIDTHGYPAWTWRGPNNIGACVHIHPKTGNPYLETQYPTTHHGRAPKYIDFDTDGDAWHCRIHVVAPGIDWEKNWFTENCHREGKRLLGLLERQLVPRSINSLATGG